MTNLTIAEQWPRRQDALSFNRKNQACMLAAAVQQQHTTAATTTGAICDSCCAVQQPLSRIAPRERKG